MPGHSRQVLDYAEWVGLDVTRREDLLWVAERGLAAPLPENWVVCAVEETEGKDVYYFNEVTGESLWDHPLDNVFREVARVHEMNPPVEMVPEGVREQFMAYSKRVQVDNVIRVETKLAHSKAPPPMVSSGAQTTRKDVASVGTQDTVGMEESHTQTEHSSADAGTMPKPADADTMTVPVVTAAATMTEAVLQSSLKEKQVSTPSVQKLESGQSPVQRACSISSYVDVVGWKKLPSPTESVRSEGAPTSPVGDAAYETEALLREMLASFQSQLVEHKREIQNSLLTDTEQQAQLEQSLTGGVTTLPPPHPSFPQPTTSSGPPFTFSNVAHTACYTLTFVAHLALCIAICLFLPTLLDGDLAPFIEALTAEEDL